VIARRLKGNGSLFVDIGVLKVTEGLPNALPILLLEEAHGDVLLGHLLAEQDDLGVPEDGGRAAAQPADDQVGHGLLVEDGLRNNRRQWRGESTLLLTLHKYLKAQSHRVQIDTRGLETVREAS